MAILDLDLLAGYLDSEINEFGLDFAATHGFLCATVVGPELKGWCKHLFDEHEKDIPKEILEQIDLWRDDILQTLLSEEHIGFPVEIEEVSVDSSLGDWSVGFVDALFLNDEAWFELAEEEDVIMLTLPMMVFSGIEGEQDLEDVRKNPDLMEEMAEEIPENLTKLFLLYHAPAG
jgi:uncharacterized protein